MKGRIMKIFIGLIVYILVFSSLPYIRQKGVSQKYKKNFNIDKFYNKDGSLAYAKLIRNNDQARIEKIRAIDNAKDKIRIGNYRLVVDDNCKTYMASLLEAAKRGVDIEIILDGNTLFTNVGKNNYFLALESFPNVHIKIYNPMNLLKPWSLMGRMHDKYMIVDDNKAFLGGRNIEDRFFKTEGKFTYDWDVLVYYKKRSEKDGLSQLENYFNNIYLNGQRNKDIKDAAIFANNKKNSPIISELESIYKEDKKSNPDTYSPINYERKLTKVGKVSLISNPVNVYSKEPVVFYEITKLMKNASDSVSIHTPYVIANNFIFKNLEEIASIAPTTLFTNSPDTGANTAGVGDYIIHEKKLRTMGIELLENEKPQSYHGKAFAIDDNISAVGSFNWDMRSVYIDTELMFVIEGEDFSKEVRDELAYYEDDATRVLSNGKRVNNSDRKISKGNFLKKFLSTLFTILFYPLRFLF